MACYYLTKQGEGIKNDLEMGYNYSGRGYPGRRLRTTPQQTATQQILEQTTDPIAIGKALVLDAEDAFIAAWEAYSKPHGYTSPPPGAGPAA
jgi:hypothetical protein